MPGIKGLFERIFIRFLWCTLSRWPLECSSYRAILGRRWSSILETCPVKRSCDFNSIASMLVISVCEYLSVGDADIPVNVENGAESALMEALKES